MRLFLKRTFSTLLLFTLFLGSSNANERYNFNLFSFQAVKDSSFPKFKKRKLRYKPDGTDFVIINGNKKFNRALYGTHTSFRIEAGDLPEFALYFPGIGGDLKLGIATPKGTKWLNDFDTVEARYRPGQMLYRLKDPLIDNAEINLQLLEHRETERSIL